MLCYAGDRTSTLIRWNASEICICKVCRERNWVSVDAALTVPVES